MQEVAALREENARLRAVADGLRAIGFMPDDYLEMEDAFTMVCPFCGANNFNGRIGTGPVYHTDGCKLGELCKALDALGQGE